MATLFFFCKLGLSRTFILVGVMAVFMALTIPSNAEEVLEKPAPAKSAPAEETPTKAAPATQADPAWMMVVVGISLLTTLAAVLVSLWLYRWRRILLSNDQVAVVPEKWAHELKQHYKSLSDATDITRDFSENLSSEIIRQSSELNRMIETFMTFKNALDEKDAEINRLRDGFDTHVYKKFLNRFIRVHQSFDEIAEGGEFTEKDLKFISVLLRDALEESSVVTFEPDIGSDYRRLGDRVADNPAIVDTENPEENFTVASVQAPGYELSGGEQEVVLFPARVTIYGHRNTLQQEQN
jgi:hypothetical protein